MRVFGKPKNVGLDIHNGAHEVDLPAILKFFDATSETLVRFPRNSRRCRTSRLRFRNELPPAQPF